MFFSGACIVTRSSTCHAGQVPSKSKVTKFSSGENKVYDLLVQQEVMNIVMEHNSTIRFVDDYVESSKEECEQIQKLAKSVTLAYGLIQTNCPDFYKIKVLTVEGLENKWNSVDESLKKLKPGYVKNCREIFDKESKSMFDFIRHVLDILSDFERER